jgi:hypothetical protein
MAMTRRNSAKIFGNDKFAEVVCALAGLGGIATAQQVSKRTLIDHSMVRDVLVRLADAGVVGRLPRASTRAAQYYEVITVNEHWDPLLRLATAICGDGAVPSDATTTVVKGRR